MKHKPGCLFYICTCDKCEKHSDTFSDSEKECIQCLIEKLDLAVEKQEEVFPEFYKRKNVTSPL